MGDERQNDISALRKRAMAVRDGHEGDLADIPSEDFQELLHELQTYQVELEMQNEELRRAQDELITVRERYTDLYDQAPIGYITTDEKGSILESNLTFAKMLGVDRPSLLGRRVSDFIVDDDQDVYYVERRALLETKGRRPWALRMHRNEAEPIWVMMEGVLTEAEEDRSVSIRCVISDITERKQADQKKKELEGQLHQAQKMEAIGTLAGGIAHDFNNILGIILGNTELSIHDIPEGNPARSNLEEVRKACLRARDMVSQILAFSRHTEHELRPVRVLPILDEALKLLRSSIPSTIEMRQDFSNDRDTILGDPTQINQVLINLCSNAAHAMREEGGILEIGLKRVELDQNASSLHPDLTPGEYLLLSTSDTGHGMEPGLIDRIFDPYFTTKGSGEGTGMGLALAHGIVKAHGGAICVRSEPGRGSVFEVYFPLIESAVEPDVEPLSAIPTGTERILFVDDENAIADLGRRMFTYLGYEVTVRTSSIEALEAFRATSDRFDLVVTDMTMPNMTGTEFSRELLRIRPDIPIVLCTGFSEMITEERIKALGIRALVMKPIAVRQIAEIVRRVLDEAEAE